MALVATLVTVIVAPGTTAPEPSRAVPAMLPRVICANPTAGNRIAARTATPVRAAIIFKGIIPILLQCVGSNSVKGPTHGPMV